MSNDQPPTQGDNLINVKSERFLKGLAGTPIQMPAFNSGANAALLMEEFSQKQDPSGSLKLPYLQSGVSRQEVTELSAKVRELEIVMLDLRA